MVSDCPLPSAQYNPLLIHIVRQINPVHTLPHLFFKIHFNIIMSSPSHKSIRCTMHVQFWGKSKAVQVFNLSNVSEKNRKFFCRDFTIRDWWEQWTILTSNCRSGFVSISVGIETRLPSGRPRSGGSIPGRAKNFYLLHNVQAGPGIHPASYPISTGRFLPGDEVAGAVADLSPSSNSEVKRDGATSPFSYKSSLHVT
jgi:hypothetical protein